MAPNALKGSLSCIEACRSLTRGIRSVAPKARIRSVPISDGGDGLIDALRSSMGGLMVSVSVRDPLGEKRRSSYLWIASKRTAIIEMARASGLALVPPNRRRPLAATTRGVGDLVRDSIRRGAKTIIVGMGGSASNDGGAGMARALGARLLDARGEEIPDGVEGLLRVERVDDSACRALLSGVRVIALSDVANPLLGPQGSARVFGPQKGATPAQVRRIEAALTRWAAVLARDLGVFAAAVPGSAAAGGLGAGLLAFARAEISPGADWVLSKTGAAASVRAADIVVTAEGRLDRTSLFGKATVALARRAKAARIPCAVVAGQVEDAARPALRRQGMTKIVSFPQAGAKSAKDSMKRAGFWAAKAAALAAAGLALAFAALPARADDALAAVDADYFHRNEAGRLDKSLAGIDAALPAAQGNAEAELLWRKARALVRRGEKKEKKSERLADFLQAEDILRKAVDISSANAPAHFWLGVTMGRRGETQGILKSLFLVKPIRLEMEQTLRLDPNHGGAYRVLAEILWQVPGFAGGDKKKALQDFETSVRLNPDHTSNYQPLAEAYVHYGRKDEAIAVLKKVADIKEPADPAEYPDDLADAKKLLDKLSK